MEYVAKDSPATAISVDTEIERQVDTLTSHPELGRPGRIPCTRELTIARLPYVAVYRIDSGTSQVEVLRILHTAQQWPAT
jgi:toxin ParE1/3/4